MTSAALTLLNRLYRLVLVRARRAPRGEMRRWVGLEQLEQRILYSVTPPGADMLLDHVAMGDSQIVIDDSETNLTSGDDLEQTAEESRPRRELVIVDSRVPDYETLLTELRTDHGDGREIEVIVIDADRDGIEQIGEALTRHQDVDAVHIFSHGTDAAVQIGDSWLDSGDLTSRANEIGAWGEALSPDADLLFYGCDLAGSADGRALTESLAELTGADVAASIDLTGNAELGGDWDLEYVTGAIEGAMPLGAAFMTSFEGVLGDPGDGTAIWVESGSSTPETADFSGTTFGPEGSTVDVGEWRVMQGAEAPTRNEKIIVGLDAAGAINGAMWNGTTWSAQPINQLGTVDESTWQSVDVAYESQSGDAILTWADGSDLKTSRWDGASWTTPSSFHNFGSAKPRVLHLAADPTSNELVLTVAADDNTAQAWVWNGTSFGNMQSIGAIADPVTINVAYEQQSGEAMVVWGKDGDAKLYHRTWDGASWGPQQPLAEPAGESQFHPGWIQLASDPTSNRIAVSVIADGPGPDNHGWVNVWDGSAWDTSEVVVTTMEDHIDHAQMAVAFETGTGEAVAVYADGTATLKYRTWTDAGGWSTEQSGPTLGALPNTMTLDADPSSDNIMLSVQDANSDLAFVRWQGATWGAPSVQETNTGEIKHQPFVFLWDQVSSNNAPTIDPTQSFNLAESAANGTSVGTVTAADPETDPLVNWAIISGNGDGIFQINGSTGEITVLDNTKLDYETNTSYVLKLQVGDGVHSSATETVAIHIEDVNDKAPVITKSQTFNITEAASNGDPVGTVVATDADKVGSLTDWTIVSGNDDGIFAIDNTTGEITIADNTNLDHETTTSYVFTLRVGDGVKSSAIETVTVDIDDANDNAPVITPSQTFNISEAASNGDSVGKPVATDADTVGSLTGWTIVSGNDDGIFTIGSTSGEITIADNSNLDSESTTSYVLTLQVGDGVNASATETVAIDIDDANDTAPVVTPSQTFNITESARNGDAVGTVVATDADTIGSLTEWTIISGNDDGIFTIGSTSGEITIADTTNLDYETTTSYVLTLQVGDGVSSSATETVTIDIDDANDTAPYIPQGQAFSINEAASDGDTVGTVVATDLDTVGSLTGWTILSGNDDGIFAMDVSSGEITIADSTNLDADTTPAYFLELRVGDGANDSSVEVVTIDVTSDPGPTGTIEDMTAAEDDPDAAIDLFAAFSDADDADADLAYTVLSNTNTGLFTSTIIDAASGTLTLSYAPDQHGAADLTVRVTDTRGNFQDTTFSVTVDPVNDEPVIVTNTGTTLVSSGSVVVTSAMLEVRDIDNLPSEITYTLTAAPDHGELRLDGAAMTAGDTFSQEDIDTDRVTYHHDGTATLDGFGFIVSDTAGVAGGSGDFDVSTIAPTLPTPPPDVLPAPARVIDVVEEDAVDTDETTDEETEDEITEEEAIATVAAESPTVVEDPGEPARSASSTSLPMKGAGTNLATPAASPTTAQRQAPQDEPSRPDGTVPEAEHSESVARPYGAEDAVTPRAAILGLPGRAKTSRHGALFDELDQLSDQLNSSSEFEVYAAGSATLVVTGMSAGYLVSLVRGGHLLASVLSSMPAWQLVDPLPILDSLGADMGDAESDEDSDSLASMIDRASSADG